MQKFVRYQAVAPNARGTYPGIFALANGLANDGGLEPEDFAWWRSTNDWCNAAYPDPSVVDPTVYDRTMNASAQSWFKTSAEHLLDVVDGYLDLLERYGVACVRVESNDPGSVLYEDEVQIVVNPY